MVTYMYCTSAVQLEKNMGDDANHSPAPPGAATPSRVASGVTVTLVLPSAKAWQPPPPPPRARSPTRTNNSAATGSRATVPVATVTRPLRHSEREPHGEFVRRLLQAAPRGSAAQSPQRLLDMPKVRRASGAGKPAFAPQVHAYGSPRPAAFAVYRATLHLNDRRRRSPTHESAVDGDGGRDHETLQAMQQKHELEARLQQMHHARSLDWGMQRARELRATRQSPSGGAATVTPTGSGVYDEIPFCDDDAGSISWADLVP